MGALGFARLQIRRSPNARTRASRVRTDFLESDGFVSALLDAPGVRLSAGPLVVPCRL